MTGCCSPTSVIRKGIVPALVVSVLCAAAFVNGESGPAPRAAIDPAILFPAGSRLLLTIDGGPCDQFGQELSLSRIWHEPEVQEFLKQPVGLLREQWNTNVKGVATELGVTPDELVGLLKSRIVIGVTHFAMDGEPKVDLMLAVELRGRQKAVEALLKMLEKQIGAGEKDVPKAATVGGIPAHSLPVPPGGPFESITYLIHDGWLVAGTSTGQLEAALARVKSGDPSGALASNSFYAASMKEVARPKTILSAWVDIGFMVETLDAMGDEEMTRMIRTTGLETVKAAAMGVELDGPSIRERFHVTATPNAPFFRYTPPTDLSAVLARVPQRSFAAYAATLNFKEYLDYNVKMLSVVPEGTEEMERVFKKIGELLGPNWRDEVLGTLGPEYAMFAALPQYGVVPDVGVLLKVGDRTKVEAAIAKGLAQLPKKEAHRSLKYGDATIEYLDLGQLEIDDDVKLRPAWTFVDGYLLVTLSPHSAKSVLVAMTQTGGGLPGREDFARAFGRLKSESPNAGNLGIGYLDFPWLAGFVLDSAIPIIQSAVGPDDLAELGPVELDLAKLPATQAIVKHLQPIVFQNQTKDGGLYGEFISPTSVVGTLVAGAGVAATLFIGEMATSPPEPVSAPGTRPIPGDEDEDR